MLKRAQAAGTDNKGGQPPSGGCVLKHKMNELLPINDKQPPSGGCVLKPFLSIFIVIDTSAATFGWLCVETAKTARN